MKVKDAMSRHCERIKIDESIKTAAQCMRDKDIGMVLVEDDKGEICGLLTDRDIACRAIAEGWDSNAEIGSCMSGDVISCHEEDDLEQAADLMEREQVRRLLVRDVQGQPCGVLAQADVARALGRSPLIGEMLGEISQPTGKHSQR